MNQNYQYVNSSSTGLGAAIEKNAARSRRSKLIVLASVIGLLGIIGIAVGVGVSVSQKNKSSTSSSSSSPGGSSNSDNTPKQTDPNDPSSFVKDSRFHKAFYGMAYTPEGSLLPDCGNSLDSVIKDIQILSQLTSRVRLYGADCNQTALVLEAIKQTKVDMQVYVGNYPVPNDDGVYTRQRDIIRDAITTYGTDHIAGITVGNEFMLNYLTSNGATDPNGSVGAQGAAMLVRYIKDTRDMLASMNLPKTIPVGNSDAGSFFSTEVLSNVDYGLSNVHAWFANTTANDAAGWVSNFFQETNVQPASLLPNNPKMYIAETGWPSKSSDVANANNGASDASEANLQIFLDTFVCQANENGTAYFYFELFDEEWKDKQFGGVEGWWGLFNKDRSLKNIKLPTCTAP
ncbi:hypothetical protein CCMSSC00406_0001036 [Pleurotus cornucopiae]|uniref:Uncharacterized protein n=1 Tax=Pleurotus cornucopiae TaxID=5321 RepID=A0ACB7IME5_PLECO|nr:hypothetical protein CCMSSC00406_0001036 [Pleurotus cornucopiae]